MKMNVKPNILTRLLALRLSLKEEAATQARWGQRMNWSRYLAARRN